jgi:hypothetical protein
VGTMVCYRSAMESAGLSRTQNRRGRSWWVVMSVLSGGCFASYLVIAAHAYPWFITGGVAAVSLVVGFICVPTKLFLGQPKTGFAFLLVAAGMLPVLALATIAPDLLDGLLVAISGLWFSTSVRGLRAGTRA